MFHAKQIVSYITDVGGFFEAGTLVRYNFLSEASAAANKDSRTLAPPPSPQEVNLTKEEVAFSFSTSSTPAILMYISSKTQDYLAVVLRDNGMWFNDSLPARSDFHTDVKDISSKTLQNLK